MGDFLRLRIGPARLALVGDKNYILFKALVEELVEEGLLHIAPAHRPADEGAVRVHRAGYADLLLGEASLGVPSASLARMSIETVALIVGNAFAIILDAQVGERPLVALEAGAQIPFILLDGPPQPFPFGGPEEGPEHLDPPFMCCGKTYIAFVGEVLQRVAADHAFQIPVPDILPALALPADHAVALPETPPAILADVTGLPPDAAVAAHRAGTAMGAEGLP